jgi:hypothetical protein
MQVIASVLRHIGSDNPSIMDYSNLKLQVIDLEKQVGILALMARFMNYVIVVVG